MRPPFTDQVVRQIQVRKHLWKVHKLPWDWCRRVVMSDAACEALERLYGAGIEPREVFKILGRAAFHGRGTWRHMKPSAAQRAGLALRSLRSVLEAVEAARPYAVTFKAMAGNEEHGAAVFSFALFASDWLPRYLEWCAEQKTGVVAEGRPKDRVLQHCAADLDELVRKHTGKADHAAIGTLLKAAFPRRFHKGAADDDDHADAVRDLIRRAQGKRRLRGARAL